MTLPDLDALEKLHDKLNRKLAVWEKKKLGELLKSFRAAETEIKALLITAEGWEKTRLELLLVEVDRVMDKMLHDTEMWVRGRSDVSPESPLASLSQFPVLTGGGTALAATGVTASFSMVHMPVLSYMQDYQLGLIRRVTQEVRDQIKEELKRGYVMGESIPDIAKRLRSTKLDKGVWPSIEKRAEVIARTEIVRASNQGALYVYWQYDVKRVMWLAAADERVCPICGVLHRRIFPIDQIPFGGPPAHPRCRCFITAHLAFTEEEGRLANAEAKKNVQDFKDWQDGKKELKLAKDAERQRIIEQYRADIKGGKYKLTVNTNKQNRHIEGTKEYKKYVEKLETKGLKPGILTADAQELVDKYAGTGKILVQKQGPSKEKITAETVVGKYYDSQTKIFLETNRAIIVYSKTGTHVYPVPGGGKK